MSRFDSWIEFLCSCRSLDHFQKSSFIAYVASLNGSEEGVILMSHSIIEILQTTNLVFARTHSVIQDYIITLLSNFATSGGPWIVKKALLVACESILESDCIDGKPEIISNVSVISALLIYAFTQRNTDSCCIDQPRVCAALVSLIDVNFDCFEKVVVEKSYASDIDALLRLVDEFLEVKVLFGVAIALLKQMEVFFVGEKRVGEKFKSLAGKVQSIDWFGLSVNTRSFDPEIGEWTKKTGGKRAGGALESPQVKRGVLTSVNVNFVSGDLLQEEADELPFTEEDDECF
jgi:hypothetical protein